MSRDEGVTILVVPEGGRESRSYTLTRSRLNALTAGVGASLLLLAVLVASWWFLAARAVQVGRLEAEIAALRADGERVRLLAAELEELEVRYEQIRSLFGSDAGPVGSDLWLPPPGARSRPAAGEAEEVGLPTSWPLSERGFVTQGLLADEEGEHPGLDIAVPSDSYVRAAGPGTVVDVGEDPVYGRFVLLEHADGYRTLYAHASTILVERSAPVLRNEIIALSGSSGRSTAPHLHFEILRNGEAVDPLTMITPP